MYCGSVVGCHSNYGGTLVEFMEVMCFHERFCCVIDRCMTNVDYPITFMIDRKHNILYFVTLFNYPTTFVCVMY